MFEQMFKNIDDFLDNNLRANNKLTYIRQTSWGMFLHCLNELEQNKVKLKGKKHKFDHHIALTKLGLTQFVNGQRFFYSTKFKQMAENVQTDQYYTLRPLIPAIINVNGKSA